MRVQKDKQDADTLFKILQRTAPPPFAPSDDPPPTTGDKWRAVRDEWIDDEREKLDAQHEPGFNALAAARGTPRPQ